MYHDCPNLIPRSICFHSNERNDPTQLPRLFIIFNYYSSWKRRVSVLRVIGVLTRNGAIKLIDKLQTFFVYRVKSSLRFTIRVRSTRFFASSVNSRYTHRPAPVYHQRNSCPAKWKMWITHSGSLLMAKWAQVPQHLLTELAWTNNNYFFSFSRQKSVSECSPFMHHLVKNSWSSRRNCGISLLFWIREMKIYSAPR